MGVKSFVKQILTEKENRRYEKLLQEKKVSYCEWAAVIEGKAKGVKRNSEEYVKNCVGGIAETDAERIFEQCAGGTAKNSTGEPMKNRAGRAAKDGAWGKLSNCSGGVAGDGIAESDSADFVVICAGRGALSVELFSNIEEILREERSVSLLYEDEDVWEGADSGDAADPVDRQLPWFKPDWSPDLLDSFFYFGSVVIMRKAFFLQMSENKAFLENNKAFLEKYTGQETDFDYYKVTDFSAYERWMHLCISLAGGYQKGCRAIRHIPGILFHSGNRQEQEKFLQSSSFIEERRQELLREFRGKYGISGTSEKPKVSVIIPSKDQPEILGKCLESCFLAAGLPEGGILPFEVIVADNGSSRENREKIQRLLQETDRRCCRAVYLYHPEEFNFSRMCNMGAEQAEGEFLLFLNDDVEFCYPGCLEKMAALAGREMTGAVGLKLYYPDSIRIQHVGITNLPMGPVHKLQFLEDDRDYYARANRCLRNVLSVTAACLMAERRKYVEAGGFSEELRVAFNDVDFCFRLYELGYQNVCVNEEYAWHHESLSRGADETQEKLERLLQERDRLYERHPALEGVDPYYSCFLNREGLDTGIRPAYLTAGNRTQEILNSSEISQRFSVDDYREDNCLMVRIEDCRGGRILGYGVILGDNNACYDRLLLLGRVREYNPEGSSHVRGQECRPEGSSHVRGQECHPGACSQTQVQKENAPEEDREIYVVYVTGQYRPDLEENMPDQVRVGLCGFDVEIGKNILPRGRYRLGMAARNRVTGLKLVNWSSRFLELF